MLCADRVNRVGLSRLLEMVAADTAIPVARLAAGGSRHTGAARPGPMRAKKKKGRPDVACRDRINRALELSTWLLDLADEEPDVCDHDGCLLLNGILRDCGLQIRRTATLRRIELFRGEPATFHERSE